MGGVFSTGKGRGWQRLIVRRCLQNRDGRFFSIPASVASRLERLLKNFLWGGWGDEFKYHLVDWERLCNQKADGGLGFRHLRLVNQALLGKWLWRYANERDGLWRKIIQNKYGSVEGDWTTKEVRSSYGVGLWKGIRRGWADFYSHIHFAIGNGSRLKFWHDTWHQGSPLSEVFPALFNIASDKNAKVSDYLRITESGVVWDPQFNHNVHNWEIKSVGEFLQLLYGIRRPTEREDKIVWGEGGGKFSVKKLHLDIKGGTTRNFPWKSVWKVGAPSKVAFFVWSAALDAILTIDYLGKRGKMLPNWCCMCRKAEETVNHLLLHCVFARDLWNLIYVIFGVRWVIPGSVHQMLESWNWG